MRTFGHSLHKLQVAPWSAPKRRQRSFLPPPERCRSGRITAVIDLAPATTPTEARVCCKVIVTGRAWPLSLNTLIK